MERRTKIKLIHTHGEKSAAYMADGCVRASGRPGICMAQVIGALNLAAGLRDAHLAHSPVIAFTGGRDPKTRFRRSTRSGRRSCVRAGNRVQRHCGRRGRFPDMVRQAFGVAVSGTPRPCTCSFAETRGRSTRKRRRWSRSDAIATAEASRASRRGDARASMRVSANVDHGTSLAYTPDRP